ncbi:MAG TPA: RDD family protein [Chryseolinea sp.]|nr:RDD family protein [Chryseolinea sp.]
MKNVEIITAQNVVLQYELASLQDRVVAFIIDLACLVAGLSILSGPLMAIASSETGGTIVVFLLWCIFIFYSLALEVLNDGRSLGKMAMKIRVIKLAGGNARFADYAARWAFRMIDIYFSLGSIAAILVLSSSKAQRIGDLIANTAVVKTLPKTNIDLSDLLSIHQANKYMPKYLQARKLREHDALLIKSALERYRRFRNRSHAEAIGLLADHISQTLGIGEIEEDGPQFLQTILKDYVVLSR